MNNWLWGAIGTVVLVAGLAAGAVGFLQPGLTCGEDDSSAGCRATPFYLGMLALGLVLVGISVPFIVRAGRMRKLPVDSAAPFGDLPQRD